MYDLTYDMVSLLLWMPKPSLRLCLWRDDRRNWKPISIFQVANLPFSFWSSEDDDENDDEIKLFACFLSFVCCIISICDKLQENGKNDRRINTRGVVVWCGVISWKKDVILMTWLGIVVTWRKWQIKERNIKQGTKEIGYSKYEWHRWWCCKGFSKLSLHCYPHHHHPHTNIIKIITFTI